MAINNFDPFDDPFESLDTVDSQAPRKRGRPRTRAIREKGPVGRPRIRPLKQKIQDHRGRPRIESLSLSEKIEREAIVSGSYGSKSVAASVKGMQKAVEAMQKSVVTPLANSVNKFAASVTSFNNSHQAILKDQIKAARDMHETYKLFMKTAIDPVLHKSARTRAYTNSLLEAMKSVAANSNNKQGIDKDSDFYKAYTQLASFEKQLTKYNRAAVVSTQVTDTYLKEYYKSSKGISKFLNSIEYAITDVAEDITALRTNLTQYYQKGNKKSIIVDQSDTLKKIEKNTRAPSIGKRMITSALSAAFAFTKTAFKYNRFGTTQFLAKVAGLKTTKTEAKRDENGNIIEESRLQFEKGGKGLNPKEFISSLRELWKETNDLYIGRFIRDWDNELKLRVRTASAGGYGEAAQKVADVGIAAKEKVSGAARSFAREAKTIGKNIVKAWDESATKKWAGWFWEVGKTILWNTYDEAGAQGERIISTVETNLSKKNFRDRFGGSHTTGDTVEDIRKYVKNINDILDKDASSGGFGKVFKWPGGSTSARVNIRPGEFTDSPGMRSGIDISELFRNSFETISGGAKYAGSSIADFAKKSKRKSRSLGKTIKAKWDQATISDEAIAKAREKLDKVEKAEGFKETLKAFIPTLYDPSIFRHGMRYTKESFNNSKVGKFVGKVGSKIGQTVKATRNSTKEILEKTFGSGAGSVALDPDSESSISTANVSTPQKAFGTLARLNARIMGYLKKMWGKVRGTDKPEKEKKESNWLSKVLGAGLLAGFLKSLKATKGKGLLGGISRLGAATMLGLAGSRGAAKAGSKALLKGGAKGRGLGATARVLWDTFSWLGSAKAKAGGTGMRAVGLFKNTKLGQSALGTTLRQLRLASAGIVGNGAKGRVAKGFIDWAKWGGGPFGLIGTAMGQFGLKRGAQLKQVGDVLKAGKGLKAVDASGKAIRQGNLLFTKPLTMAEKLRNAGTGIVNAGKGAVTGIKNAGTAAVVGAKGFGSSAAKWASGAGESVSTFVKNIGKSSTVTKAAAKGAGAAGAGVAAKAGLKAAGKGATKGLLKRIPLLGAIIGIAFGIHRFTKGQWLDGIMEITSGLLSLDPTGTVSLTAGLALDAAIVKRDFDRATKKKSLWGDTKSKIDKESERIPGDVLGILGPKQSKGSKTNYVASNQAAAGGQLGLMNQPSISNYDPTNKSYSKPGFFERVDKKLGEAWDSFKGSSLGTKLKESSAGKAYKSFQKASQEYGGINALTNAATNAYKGAIGADTHKYIQWNGYSSNLHPKFLSKLVPAAKEYYEKTGRKISINSSLRDDRKQAELFVRGRYLKEPGIWMPALPGKPTDVQWKGQWYHVPGSGSTTLTTGHRAGAAVDIDNPEKFAPYANKYGITWFGKKDPPHFQINDRLPVVSGTASQAPANAKVIKLNSEGAKVGDPYTPQTHNPDPIINAPYNNRSSQLMPNPLGNNIGSTQPAPPQPAGTNEVSPLVQDYGLSIINNLLFI